VSTATEALGFEAVQLFLDRATAVLPEFMLSDDLSPAVGEICRRLDGMPLAIELAAARVRALSVQQIAERLDDCFSVLGTTRRAELARHQTLRATIDWSYDLLAEEERRVLRNLSVFVDSFTPQAAEHVAIEPDGTNVLNVVGRLVDKSLLFVSERATESGWRYRLLDTVRQYAHEKLLGDGNAADVLRRHAEYYLTLAEAAEPRINTSERVTWLAVIAREHSIVRAAMERALNGGEFGHASRLTSAMFWFWFHRGLWREGRTFLQAALAHEPGPHGGASTSSARRWRTRLGRRGSRHGRRAPRRVHHD
jgi:predicted ATPase